MTLTFKQGETEIDFRNMDYKNIIILGNGFDLDLGYNTSYKHFFENKNDVGEGGFPFVKGGEDYHALGRFILEKAMVYSWFDLENVLAKYGSSKTHIWNQGEDSTTDRMDYDMLVKSLCLYLKSLDLSNPRKDSVAARVFYSLKYCLNRPAFYSFNYTNVEIIGASLGISTGPITYVHGSLEKDNIILGVGDYENLPSCYDYMYKTSNLMYRSTNLIQDLDSCERLIVYGLSMSQVDYPYFKDFFKKVASGEYGTAKKKYIRIFTRDEESRMGILRNLRMMNEGMLALLNYSDFDIIRTKDNIDESKVTAILEKINKEW